MDIWCFNCVGVWEVSILFWCSVEQIGDSMKLLATCCSRLHGDVCHHCEIRCCAICATYVVECFANIDVRLKVDSLTIFHGVGVLVVRHWPLCRTGWDKWLL